MKSTKRHLAMLLCVSMFASLASCGSNETPEDTAVSADTAVETTVESETTAEESRLAIPDDLPEKTFGGDDFIIMGCYPWSQNLIVPDEQNGESVNDALYNRNQQIGERFEVKIQYSTGGLAHHDDAAANVEKTIMAGDGDAFDLLMFHVVANSGNAVKGLYLNWYDIPHINFEKPWWSASTTEDLTINNRCFLAIGDVSLDALAQTYAILYDKTALETYSEENLYNVVTEGRWTLDYLGGLSERVYKDVNGNGEADKEDYYGYASDQMSNLGAYFWATGNKIFTKNASGELEFTYYSENLVNAFNSCQKLFGGIGVDITYSPDQHLNAFMNSQVLSVAGCLKNLRNELSEYENEIGVVPMPKLNDAQENYYTMADGSHEAMAIGKSAADPEYVGIITEALCAESFKTVIPAFYDECLKSRYASSPEDAEMIELCVDSCIFDWGYVYDNWKGIAFLFGANVNQSGKDITAIYESKEESALKYYMDKVMPLFTE